MASLPVHTADYTATRRQKLERNLDDGILLKL